MSKSIDPWRDLPPQLADVLAPEVPRVIDEIVSAIGHEVPEYARPLEDAFGKAVRAGVDEALRRFVSLIRDHAEPSDQARAVYVALGRNELRSGRTLDSLQAAYRVGARVAWRGFARAAHDANVDRDIVARLAEAVFAYLDGISAESIEGYTQARAERAGEHERRRAELVATLLGRLTGADPVALAQLVDWRLPPTAAAVACPADRLAGLARRVGPDALAAPFDGLGCVIVPDAAGPGRHELVALAASGRPAAIGPDVLLEQLPLSWQLARGTLDLADGISLAVADEHLAELLVARSAAVVERIAARRLAPFEQLTPAARDRMRATALAYVQHVGNAAAIGRALHIHPQTARYRVARLRELLGDQLDDPTARFELEAALRGRDST